MNILQGIVSAIQQPAVALHTGESYFAWRQYVALVEGRTLCQTLLNHTADPELKRFITSFLGETEEPEMDELSNLMKQQGIEFPSLVTEKPQTKGAEVPAGAHFSDQEICHLLIGKLEMLMLYCFLALTQTLRNDLALLFARYLADLSQQGMKLKQLADKRGWLLHPPPFAPSVPH